MTEMQKRILLVLFFVCLHFSSVVEGFGPLSTTHSRPPEASRAGSFSAWSWLAGKISASSSTKVATGTTDIGKTVSQQPVGSTLPAPTSGRKPLILCSWNIFRFGPAKFSLPDLLIKAGLNVSRMDIIVDQLSDCHITAIQEYMDLSLTAIEKLRKQLVAKSGHEFSVILSPRIGRTSFEQYVFLYREDKVLPVVSHLYPDNPKNKLFHREPFFTKFQLLDPSNKGKESEFVLGTIHTAPDEAVSEIGSLVVAFDWATQNFSNQNIMILGDYNADCSYVRERDWPNIPLWTESRFTWLVSKDMDTTSMSTHCAYDRAVYLGSVFRDTYIVDSIEAPDFPHKFGLTSAQAKLVSDHRLIRMDFNL